MVKTPIIISVLLTLVAIASSYFLWSSALQLEHKIGSQIALGATLGALISAAFVIWSFIQTNKAFIESKRPQLLIQVESVKLQSVGEPVSMIPWTKIHYSNITDNKFDDLTIQVFVYCETTRINFNHLFRTSMSMIARDSRVRSFKTYDEIENRGFNLRQLANDNRDVFMNLQYEYSFNGARDLIDAQLYKWNKEQERWDIS